MQRAIYPKEQMHRIKYTKITKEEIGRKLAARADWPACASAYSDALSGKSIRIVTDGGPVLKYEFKDKRKLTIAEGDGFAVEAAYGALELQNAVFFSHMVPKILKGYNVVIDLERNLATVFEVWFAGDKDSAGLVLDDREVQRHIYYGYVDVPGKDAPKTRHTLTNRVEGRGFHWKQDTGIETLELYPSVVSSSFVELTRFGGELTFCSPSDYVKVNDHLFIYDRTECEFSGIFTMYLMDLLSVMQVGVRLGFNEKDELEYYLFRGTGEIVGQLAHFEPFNDHGEKIVLGPSRPQTSRKGERPVYRPFRDNQPMPEEEVWQAVQKSTKIFPGGSAMAGNKMEISDYLAGKELTVRYDNGGPVWNYRFDDRRKLRWRREGESQWHEEIYEAFEPDEDLIFFAHLHSGTRPPESVQIVLDFRNGLTSCVDSKLGSAYMANEVSYRFIFGVMEMPGLVPPRYWRHAFTDELVGHAYTWNYADTLTSMHVYSTPHSYSWTIFMDNGALGMQWSSPSQYAKLRDGVYLFSWVEEACNGGQGTIVINTKTMHDAGFSFGGGKDGLNLGTMGAFARHAGFYDIKKYFGPKA
ncbi:MAG: MoaF N-terminal domain-containing protein [Acidobacteria bacterium]|nr:MoaF N-terminal domain-containing protein [Acidobacteriota bacterium]